MIVLASTDFDPHQAERRTIAGISGNTITLDSKLDYMHYGKITFGVDERGEVGVLSRNILIQASPDADKTLFGGHIMAMTGSRMYVSGVELNRMGQNMLSGPVSDSTGIWSATRASAASTSGTPRSTTPTAVA